MKLTTSQKICSWLLVAALSALALDQLCGNAPPSARAIAAALPASVVLKADDAGSKTSATPPHIHTLAARLREMQTASADLSQMRDAFAPSARWIASGDSDRSLPIERALKFQRSHQLKAIVESGARGQALVDSTLMNIGQSIDGYQLSSVSKLNAFFTDGESQVVLRLINSGPDAEKAIPSQ